MGLGCPRTTGVPWHFWGAQVRVGALMGLGGPDGIGIPYLGCSGGFGVPTHFWGASLRMAPLVDLGCPIWGVLRDLGSPSWGALVELGSLHASGVPRLGWGPWWIWGSLFGAP